jgi:hypothetical protein
MTKNTIAESSSSAAVEKDHGNHAFICIHCGTPCVALYRQLSASLSSIKAMNCVNSKCRQVVDPYIEREWLLVAIDCILLRPEAYRHVLFNAKEHFETVNSRRTFQLVLASSILHAYLKFETIKTTSLRQGQGNEEGMQMPSINVWLLVLTSVLDIMVQWSAVCLFLNYNMSLSKAKRKFAAHNLATQIFWSLILPSAFQVVSIFVLIWENSKITRALGSLLIACWQGLAISLVADGAVPKSGKSSAAVGILAVMLCRLARTQLVPQEACVGFEVDLFFHQPSEHKLFLPLCLT